MSMRIYTDNSIEIDGVKTGLKVTQTGKGTVVYIPERPAGWQGVSKRDVGRDENGKMEFVEEVITLEPRSYSEIKMPHQRYSLAHDAPASGAAGRTQFENDIRAVLAQ